MAKYAEQMRPYDTRAKASMALAVIGQQVVALFDVLEHDPEAIAGDDLRHAIELMLRIDFVQRNSVVAERNVLGGGL